MTLQIPDSMAAQSGYSPQELIFGLAVGLVMDGRLSLGQAGAALGLSKPEFMQLLHQRGIPMPYDEKEVETDLHTLRRLFPEQPALPA
jgi:predicted HTH domain antitoxin